MKLFADFRQIHVCAPDSKTSLEEAWTAQATDDRIAAAGDIVGIGTEQADDVDVTVEILNEAPPLEAGEHVTEASLRLRGEVMVLGCTDLRAKAKCFPLGAPKGDSKGTWRLRATHTNLAKREKIKLQLWPAKAAKAKVLTRYAPPAPPPKKPMKAPKNRKQAVAAALEGNIDVALEVLLRLHGEGDAAASASAAEILAFQDRWDEAARCAKKILANPDAVYAGNVIDDMKALVQVAKKGLPKSPPPEPARRERYDDAVKMAEEGKRYKGKPLALTQHCFSLAVVFGVDDAILARWDPEHPYLHFDEAAHVARALVRRGDAARAWEILESRLSRWYPVDAAQVLPVVLLTDPLLAPLMTPERRALVLRTPRAA